MLNNLILAAAEVTPPNAFDGIGKSMTDSFSQASSQTIEIIGAIAPYAIAVFVCKYCWNQGKKFFNNMGK